MKNLFVAIIFSLLFQPAFASIKVRILRTDEGIKFLSSEQSLRDASQDKQVLVRSIPYFLSEGPESTIHNLYQEYIVNENSIPTEFQNFNLNTRAVKKTLPGAEVKTLVEQGAKENRINLTILGDGYTAAEKERFFEDAARTVKGLFNGVTFASYLPLFNVYAVFVPSHTSGIGEGRPKDTAFGLYRNPAGSKRAIMPGNERALQEALNLAPATDYPIVLANDEFYGGLGGRYAISTRSVRSGLIVLRHELGHNFGEVGEEYDGGYVYAGANSSPSINVTWPQWIDGRLKVNEAQKLAGDYIWKNLSTGPFGQQFIFPSWPGTLFLMDISTVGWATPNDVSVTFDGAPLALAGDFHNDRNFYQIGPVAGFNPGRHTVVFEEKIHDGDNVLAFSNIYALAPGYDFTPKKVGAYATFDINGRKSYRPTHSSCPMRDMLAQNFCQIDKENMWHKFLNRVSLIDSLSVLPSGQNGDREITVGAPKLNGLEIFWFKRQGAGEVELTQLRNVTTWKAPANVHGSYVVRVRFTTPEARVYSNRFMAQKPFNL